MASDARVVRQLVAFRKDPHDDLVGEWELRDISLQELQALFGASPEDPMYASWQVKPEHITRLARAVDHEIDLGRFDYFVEAVAD